MRQERYMRKVIHIVLDTRCRPLFKLLFATREFHNSFFLPRTDRHWFRVPRFNSWLIRILRRLTACSFSLSSELKVKWFGRDITFGWIVILFDFFANIMAWTKEATHKLIGLWECHECLWNMRVADFRNKVKRENAFAEIAAACGKTSTDVKNKIHSLRSQMSGKNSGILINFKFIYFIFLFSQVSVQKSKRKNQAMVLLMRTNPNGSISMHWIFCIAIWRKIRVRGSTQW